MTRDAFEFMRRFIHLLDNKKSNKRVRELMPLVKVKEVFDTIISQFWKVWTARIRVTINKSIIKSME